MSVGACYFSFPHQPLHLGGIRTVFSASQPLAYIRFADTSSNFHLKLHTHSSIMADATTDIDLDSVIDRLLEGTCENRKHFADAFSQRQQTR